jgi:hypothetical protein
MLNRRDFEKPENSTDEKQLSLLLFFFKRVFREHQLFTMCMSASKPLKPSPSIQLNAFPSLMLVETNTACQERCQSLSTCVSLPLRRHCALLSDRDSKHVSTKKSTCQPKFMAVCRSQGRSPPSPPPPPNVTRQRRNRWQQSAGHNDSPILIPKRLSSPLRRDEARYGVEELAKSRAKHVRFAVRKVQVAATC